MHFTVLLCLAFAGVSFASPTQITGVKDIYGRSEAAPQDGTAIKAMIKALQPPIEALTSSLNAVTASNVATQLADANAKSQALNAALVSQAEKLAKSKALGLLDVMGLLTPAKSIATTLNGTFTALATKKDVIKAAGQVDLLGQGIKSYVLFLN